MSNSDKDSKTVSTTTIEEAAAKLGEVFDILKIDWANHPHMKDTPRRVIKSWVNDFMIGLFSDSPKVTSFENDGHYDGMVCQTNIPIVSVCQHHLAPYFGYAHVAYIPAADGKVIGLSKINRVCDHLARRPSVQENLTMSIHNEISMLCVDNLGVAVTIEANHTCCSLRGIKHASCMRTAKMSGAFLDNADASRAEFYKFVEFAVNNRGTL